jgi:hypothetical protein
MIDDLNLEGRIAVAVGCVQMGFLLGAIGFFPHWPPPFVLAPLWFYGLARLIMVFNRHSSAPKPTLRQKRPERY